jgi:hypothetical protein
MVFGWTTTQLTERINTSLKAFLVNSRRRAIGVEAGMAAGMSQSEIEAKLTATSQLWQVGRINRLLTHLGKFERCVFPPPPLS